MTELRREGSAVRYYCTAGNGMEAFLNDEVKTKLAAEDVCQIAGKVLFSSSAKIDRVRNLKAAERLFLLLIQDSPLRLSAYSSPAKAASVLQARLLRDKNQWTSAVMTWSRLQGELESSKTAVKKSSSALGVTRKEKEKKKGRGNGEQRDEGEKCLEESRISTGEQREEEIGFGRQRCSEQNGVHTMEKKRRRDDDEEEGKDKERNVAAQDPGIEKTVEAERMREEGMLMELSTCRKKCRHGADFSGRGSGCDHTASRLEDHGESHSRRMDDISKDFTREVKTTGERNKMLLTTSKDKTEMPSCVPVSFRISCKCTGSLSRCLNAQEVSRVIGVGLNRLLGWKADLKNPQLEINVHLSDDYCLLGIPLTRLPLATRSYMKITGLRSTVAWAMASLADIQPGFCVVDPMCGVGTILIEAAQEYEDACFLGVDIDDEQLQKASENIAFAELRKRIHLLKASSLVLPLPSASVDAVICDLPFGRKFSSRVDMAANLPLILTEMERVLRTDGTLVLLLSPQLSCLLKKLLMQKDTRPTSNPETKPRNCPLLSQETEPQHSLPLTLSSLMHQATFRVSLGAIDGLIHKYVKTDC